MLENGEDDEDHGRLGRHGRGTRARPKDAPAIAQIRTAVRPQKGAPWRIESRKFYDALMEGVSPRDDVTSNRPLSAVSRASGASLRQSNLTRPFCMCTAGGSSREPPQPIATLSGTSPRRRARRRLCGLSPCSEHRFLQP